MSFESSAVSNAGTMAVVQRIRKGCSCTLEYVGLRQLRSATKSRSASDISALWHLQATTARYRRDPASYHDHRQNSAQTNGSQRSVLNGLRCLHPAVGYPD